MKNDCTSCFICKAKFRTKILYKCNSCDATSENFIACRDSKGSICETCKARRTLVRKEIVIDLTDSVSYNDFIKEIS